VRTLSPSLPGFSKILDFYVMSSVEGCDNLRKEKLAAISVNWFKNYIPVPTITLP
jgi:hypothetical protein